MSETYWSIRHPNGNLAPLLSLRTLRAGLNKEALENTFTSLANVSSYVEVEIYEKGKHPDAVRLTKIREVWSNQYGNVQDLLTKLSKVIPDTNQQEKPYDPSAQEQAQKPPVLVETGKNPNEEKAMSEKYWCVKRKDGSFWPEHHLTKEDAENDIVGIDESQGYSVVEVEIYEKGKHPDTILRKHLTEDIWRFS